MNRPGPVRWVRAAAAALASVALSPALAADAPHPGESLYRLGLLRSGAPVSATRDAGGARIAGAAAACVNCHRRSGLGSTEGLIAIPPITGRYLFRPRAAGNERDLPYVEGMRIGRAPYSDVTLARAIREGIDAQGRPLGYLMPRYALDDADLADLIEYLKSLDPRRLRGVTDTLLHFATIVTPEADPAKRTGMLDVLQHYFADKNTFPFPPSPPLRSSASTAYAKSMYLAQRHWQLHVWELTGPSHTWGAQLDRHLAEEPVMAAVSGLGGAHWAPVHEFCERARLPCLFPNVEVPVVAGQDFYTLYFSRGLLLEADLIRERIEMAGAHPPRAVAQIYRSGDAGEAAARALAAALGAHGVVVHAQAVPRSPSVQDLAAALHRVAGSDALVLWLRPADLAALGDPAAAPPVVYVSGLMGGLEHAPLPAPWRPRAQIAFPFDLPDRSRVRLDYPLGWFSIRRIPVIAEQVQVDTYLACGVLAETLSHMADVFVPEYLVERAEEILEHRVLTGPYPRLTLAEGQRFASKGGYLVKFAAAQGSQVTALAGWTVP